MSLEYIFHPSFLFSVSKYREKEPSKIKDKNKEMYKKNETG